MVLPALLVAGISFSSAAGSTVLNLVSTDPTTVQLAWEDSQFPETVSRYNVYRLQSENLWVLIGQAETTGYIDADWDGQPASYRVTAINNSGESEPSNVVEIRSRVELLIQSVLTQIAEIQLRSRQLRDSTDAMRLDLVAIEEASGNDPRWITRRFGAGNAVRQLEILLSHLNSLDRLIREMP